MKYWGGIISIGIILLLMACNQNSDSMDEKKILFLHHSTGNTIWRGGNDIVTKVKAKMGMRMAVEKWFAKYNKTNKKNYVISEKVFPKKEPYGWKNYPFDYYNIWVKHGDEDYYQEEPTLKVLTQQYDMIIFKHCFPVSHIVFDGEVGIDSERKMVENYKLQYQALKNEMHKYPDTKFLIWTPTALTERATNPKSAKAASDFAYWVINEWDEPGDNIFLWDFRALQTGGDNYVLPENAVSDRDSHPSHAFAKANYPLFCRRIVDVIEGMGDQNSLTAK